MTGKMKEVTIIERVQITCIGTMPHDHKIDKKQLKKTLKADLEEHYGCDDALILDVKIFERDVEDGEEQ